MCAGNHFLRLEQTVNELGHDEAKMTLMVLLLTVLLLTVLLLTVLLLMESMVQKGACVDMEGVFQGKQTPALSCHHHHHHHHHRHCTLLTPMHRLRNQSCWRI